MPPGSFVVKLSFRMVDADPDGTPCDDCGSPVFLSARAYQMKEENVSPRRRELGKGQWEHLYTLCASCADCWETEFEECEDV